MTCLGVGLTAELEPWQFDVTVMAILHYVTMGYAVHVTVIAFLSYGDGHPTLR